MKLKSFVWLLIVLMIAGCGTTSKVADLKANADQAFAAKNYTTALIGYEQIIKSYQDEGRTDECPAYGKAGLAAMQTGNVNKALDYLQMDTYTPYVSGETYFGLAKGYREIDNLSKEMIALKDYVEKFPDGDKIQDVKMQLFETYVESKNWEPAAELWPQLSEKTTSSEEMLEKWFKVNMELENDEVCASLSSKLLELNPTNIPALEFKAESTFQEAEDHYQREMKAYEENQTNKQYKRLLDELDKITAKFKVALADFEKLYNLDPKPEYARFLSNIYVRFNDKEKSEFYRKLSGN